MRFAPTRMSQASLLAVLMTLLGGCGDDTTSPINRYDGGPVDIPSTLPDAPTAQCNVVEQDCEAHLGCTLGSEDVPVCTAVGTRGEFEACGDDPTSCARGFLCLAPTGDQSVKTCRRMCDRITSEPCRTTETCMPTVYGGVGFCMEFTYCDPLLQDCANADQRCFPTGSSTVCRSSGGSIPEGDLCNPMADACAKGLACVELEGYPDTCRPFCLLETAEGCDPGEECFPYLEDSLNTYGVCSIP